MGAIFSSAKFVIIADDSPHMDHGIYGVSRLRNGTVINETIAGFGVTAALVTAARAPAWNTRGWYVGYINAIEIPCS